MNGKGDAYRPYNKAVFDRNWVRIFKPKKPKRRILRRHDSGRRLKGQAT